MPSQTTLIQGSMAAGAGNGQHDCSPPPSMFCQSGATATLESCSPPFERIAVTYLRPIATRPRPTARRRRGPARRPLRRSLRRRLRSTLPWLPIVGIAAVMAVAAMGATHLLGDRPAVEVADSALSAHADLLMWRVTANVEPRPPADPVPDLPRTQPPAHDSTPFVLPSQLPPIPSVIPIPGWP